jgi:hypothetical protein
VLGWSILTSTDVAKGKGPPEPCAPRDSRASVGPQMGHTVHSDQVQRGRVRTPRRLLSGPATADWCGSQADNAEQLACRLGRGQPLRHQRWRIFPASMVMRSNFTGPTGRSSPARLSAWSMSSHETLAEIRSTSQRQPVCPRS